MILLSDDWDLEEVEALRGFSVETRLDHTLIVSRKNDLFETTINGGSIEDALRLIGRFPARRSRTIIAASRLGQRALRFMFYNVVPLGNRRFFCTFGKSVGVVDDHGRFELLEPVRPTRVLRGACARSADGALYFGEYISNSDRGPIRIYRYRDDRPGDLEVAFEFAAGEIRHVHGLFWDSHTESLWCVSGDIKDECRILKFDESLSRFETIGTGDESWRAVSLVFTPEAVFYGMDAEFTQNFLYRINRSDGSRTRLNEVEGPVYYSTSNTAGHYFGVTAELCPSQTEPVASIWHLSGTGEARRLVKAEKDRWHHRFLMPGTIHFPITDGRSTDLLFSTVGVERDNRVYRLSPSQKSNSIPAV